MTVLNDPPKYTDPLFTSYAPVIIHVKSFADIAVPAFSDPENLAASFDVTKTTALPLLYSFDTVTRNIRVGTASYKEIGTHNLDIRIYDAGQASFTLT